MSSYGPIRRKRAPSTTCRRSKKDDEMVTSKLKNLYECAQKIKGNEQKYRNNNPWVPQHPSQILVVGPTGAGKTNLVLNYLEKSGSFDDIQVCAKDLEEPLYRLLKHDYPDSEEVFMTSNINELPTVDSLDPKKQHAVIFDDFVTDKKAGPQIVDHFIRGRKKNCTDIYLSQSYTSTPLNVRRQMSDLFLRNIRGKRDLKTILRDFNLDIDIDELVAMYQEATHDPMDFFHIALKAPPARQFQKNFCVL
jgi:hypothetical protein